MKTFYFRVNLLLLCAILLLSSGLLIANDGFPTINTTPSIFKLIILAVLAIYEVIVRLIPSVGNYSLIAFIIDILKKLSDVLNQSKNK